MKFLLKEIKFSTYSTLMVLLLFPLWVNAQNETTTETIVQTQTETREVSTDKKNHGNGPRAGIKGGLNVM